MLCRKYTAEDYSHIKEWYVQRDMAPDSEHLPKLGFIVEGVAAGFLMQTDCKSCILEPFIGNLTASPRRRDLALDMIMSELIEAAKVLGYKRIWGFSSHRRMVKRAIGWGFKSVEICDTVCKEI